MQEVGAGPRLTSAAQPALRAARRRERADDPDRPRHRLRPPARLPAGARGAKGGGEAVAPSLLFFGCRHPDHDWFCRDEIERWQAEGVADLHLAFSRGGEPSVALRAARYRAEQERVYRAIQDGAAIFLCGDGRFMAPAVRDTLIRIRMQQAGVDVAGLGLAGGTDRDRPLPPGRLRFWQVSRS
ncbi:hypothetical protein AB5I41_01865 [Sphingomonas sp. MMS24-JH45]